MTTLADARAALRARYRAGLRDKIELLRGWLSAEDPADDADQIRRLAHQLRGSGSSFGFPQITEAAAAVERAEPGALPAATRALIEILAAAAADPDDGSG